MLEANDPHARTNAWLNSDIMDTANEKTDEAHQGEVSFLEYNNSLESDQKSIGAEGSQCDSAKKSVRQLGGKRVPVDDAEIMEAREKRKRYRKEPAGTPWKGYI